MNFASRRGLRFGSSYLQLVSAPSECLVNFKQATKKRRSIEKISRGHQILSKRLLLSNDSQTMARMQQGELRNSQ